jgi:hypothetical protein
LSVPVGPSKVASFTQQPGGALVVPVSSAGTGSIIAASTAALTGSVTLAPVAGYVPTGGATNTLVNAPAGLSGTFTTVNNPPGQTYTPDYIPHTNPTTATVTVSLNHTGPPVASIDSIVVDQPATATLTVSLSWPAAQDVHLDTPPATPPPPRASRLHHHLGEPDHPRRGQLQTDHRPGAGHDPAQPTQELHPDPDQPQPSNPRNSNRHHHHHPGQLHRVTRL